MSETTVPKPRPTLVLRLVLAGMAIAVAWLSLTSYGDWKTRFAALAEISASQGVVERRPEIVDSMRRDAGSTRATLRLARAILADELDQRWILDLPAADQDAERQKGLDRLDIAYDLGLESLNERPGSWEALLVIGGSEYLRLTRRRDRALLGERDRWLLPLQEAHRLAPVQPEPLRFLVAADLGNWSVLTSEGREQAVARLEMAFKDPVTFNLLSSAWLRVAPSRTQALQVIPDTAWAWASLMNYFSRLGDWERYCDARRKHMTAVRVTASERLDEAESRLRWGDRPKGIQRLVWVGANTPPDIANVALMERLLATFPPGAGGEASDRWLRSWLDWTVERCGYGSCPLSEASFLRLIGLHRELPHAVKARALAAAGSLRDAETIARANRPDDPLLATDWIPYDLSVAPLLVTRGNAVEALSSLKTISDGDRSLVFWRTLSAVAAAAGNEVEGDRARTALSSKARRTWSPTDWVVSRRVSRLELWPLETADGLSLEIATQRGGEGTLEFLWDGSTVDVRPATDGRVVHLEVQVTADAHLLEIRSAEGATSATASVQLLPPAQ